MATSTENPSFAAVPDAQPQQRARADLEAAVASLHASFNVNVNDGNEAESVETLERLLRAHGDELRAEFAATLETKLAQAAPLSAAVRSAVAHLTEAPLNFHQATVMYAAEQSGDDGEAAGSAQLLLRRAGSLVLSALMVLMQCMVAMGVALGTAFPACASSDQCAEKGTWCEVGGIDRCVYCGDAPLPPQADPATGGTLNWADAPDYAGFNLTLVAEVCAAPTDRLGMDGLGSEISFPRAGVVSYCETCVFNDGQVDELTAASLTQANVAVMGPFDWFALVFATVVVALTTNGELKVRAESEPAAAAREPRLQQQNIGYTLRVWPLTHRPDVPSARALSSCVRRISSCAPWRSVTPATASRPPIASRSRSSAASAGGPSSRPWSQRRQPW